MSSTSMPHPVRSPGRSERWPAAWRREDAAIVLITLAMMVLIQALLLATARSRAGYQDLNGLAFAVFPTSVTAIGLLLRARLRGLSLRELGLVRPREWRPVLFAWVIALLAGPLTALGGAGGVIGGAPLEGGLRALGLPATDPASLALLALVIAVLVPLVEELIFRGLVHRTVRTRWPLIPSAILSGVIFAAAHLDPSTLLPLFIVGFVFAWSYERSGSLWGSILPHGGLNALTLLVAITR